MDAERLPLLYEARRRRERPLTVEEVRRSQHQVPWRRAQYFIIVMFWATMAMFLSAVVCILMTSACSITGKSPTVPPVHLTFAPLLSRTLGN